MRRPKLHFTTHHGWMNDPNGLVYVDGTYHMFYQHYPEDVYWGPMHWGHAISRDLLHWEHLPIALYPDKQGYIFSGSCFYDKENRSQFGSDGKPPLLAFYTSHDPDTGREEQYLAYSTDCVHFEKYSGNPVIVCPREKDFRDPKVFAWTDGAYRLAVAAGDKVLFYSSGDLLHWEVCGQFSLADYGIAGICECPDCIRFVTDDGEQWVLSFSLIIPEEKVKEQYDISKGEFFDSHVGIYFVGQFDGHTFHVRDEQHRPYLLDYGADCYAAVTFQNVKGKNPVMIGWAENWSKINDTPAIADICRGKMTLARTLTLSDTVSGYRLSARPVIPGTYMMFAVLQKNETHTFNPMQPLMASCDVAGKGTVKLCNGGSEQVILSVTEREIVLETMEGMKYHAERLLSGTCHIDLVYDEGILEIYAENGLITFTQNVYPVNPFTRIIYL